MPSARRIRTWRYGYPYGFSRSICFLVAAVAAILVASVNQLINGTTSISSSSSSPLMDSFHYWPSVISHDDEKERIIQDLRRQIARMEQERTLSSKDIININVSSNDTTAPNKAIVLNPGFCRTSSTGYEILLESLLGSFFQEDGFLPVGSVLDVGAQFGEQACHFASLAPERTVHALDPSPTQSQQIIDKFAKRLPNLKVQNAGIGRHVGTAKVDGPGFTGMKAGDEFQVETIDNLFYDKGETLGFAHIDVEGLELDVLLGGNKTIKANLPIFTVELRVHKDPSYSKALLDHINNELGYDAYVVDEPCGWPHMDYRNLLAIPRSSSRGANLLEFSDAFNLALATDAIFRVNSKSIFDKVYPCCALGGECCPYETTSHKGCCNEKHMKKWHEQHGRKPVAMQGFTYSRKHTLRQWAELRKRVNMTPEQAVA